MAERSLQVLLVGGPMYDPLYARLREFEQETGWQVRVVAALPHPALNARIAGEFSAGRAAYDVISTHTKYAPSQCQWLTPLDADLTRDELAGFNSHVLDLARMEGALYGLPRNLDVKLLYYRKDLFDDSREHARYQARTGRPLAIPKSWEDLRAIALYFARGPDLYGFTFPGRDSGLFGHFFELQAMAGGRLLTETMEPAFDDDAGRWALGLLVDLYRQGAAPPQTPTWHYDEVARCFQSGKAAMTTDWPGGFYAYNDPALCRVSQAFDVAIYPKGAAGRYVYAGSHTFAIPITAKDRQAALRLVRFLTSEASQLLEARLGSLPTRPAVLRRVRAESPPGSLASRRWTLLEETTAAALFPPRHPRFAPVEDVLWRALRQAMMGELGVEAALAEAARRVAQVAHA